MSPFGNLATEFFRRLGRLVADVTLEPMSSFDLRQRISVAVQCGSAAAILDSMPLSA